MALIRARSSDGTVADVSEAWLERWPEDFTPLTDAELAAEAAELQRAADANAAQATPPQAAVEQPAPAPAAEPTPEQTAPRGRF